MAALTAHQVHARRGGRLVLHGVSLQAHAGQWLAIVGPNGAGKSTLLRSLAGLLPVVQGEVRLQGRVFSHWPLRERARALAWLGQQSEGDEAMTVHDTVALARMPYQGWLGLGGLTEADRLAIEQALLDTDLQDKAQRTLGALSGGERQRVNLARALAVQAPVLLLDEPVAHLDAPHQRLVAQVLKREAAQGRCVVSVLHELPLALHADQIAVMQTGHIKAHGAAHDEAVHRSMEAVFEQAIRIAQVEMLGQYQWTVLPQFEFGPGDHTQTEQR